MEVVIRFVTGLKEEVQRVVQCSRNISLGFYQNQRFLLSQILIPETPIIYLPKLDFSVVPDYWDKVSKIDENIDFSVDEFSALQGQISLKSESTMSTVERFEKEFDTKKESIQSLIDIFDFEGISTMEITVKVVSFGTNLSFSNPIVEGNKVKFWLFLRSDMPVDYVVEGIFSVLVGMMLKKDSANFPENVWMSNWEINESIVDFILLKTKLRKCVPKYVGTIDGLRQNFVSPELITKSKQSYLSFGFPIESALTLKGNSIFLGDLNVESSLTVGQKKILKLFMTKRHQLVTPTEIGDILWQSNNEKFSLWAISKQIQKLRDALKKLGLKQDVLLNVRGQGYILYD
jgi:hypothetical protein